MSTPTREESVTSLVAEAQKSYETKATSLFDEILKQPVSCGKPKEEEESTCVSLPMEDFLKRHPHLTQHLERIVEKAKKKAASSTHPETQLRLEFLMSLPVVRVRMACAICGCPVHDGFPIIITLEIEGKQE